MSLKEVQEITDRINRTSPAEFVQRLKIHPLGPRIQNPDGSYSTVKMGYVQEGDKDVIFPWIQYIDGKLVDFSNQPDRGYESAIYHGDTIQVPSGMGEEWTTKYKQSYPGFSSPDYNYLQYIESDKEGSKIHIKESHKGRFTDYCGGKVTNECIAKGKASKDPKVRKMATFAQNARKWN